MLPTLPGAIAALRRRWFLHRWVEGLGRQGTIALLGAGCAALLGRVLLSWGQREALAVAALAGIVLVTALLRARRLLPRVERASAWLDVSAGATGRIVTESELGASAWSEAARHDLARSLAILPRIPWWRALRSLIPALGFLVAALLVPIPRMPIGPPPILAQAALAGLEQKLATLEETLDLAPETAEELAARLERVEAAADEGNPASAFEAIDRLDERLDLEAERALDAARRATPDLDRAAGDPALADAQSALEQALSSLGEAGLAKDLPDALQDALLPGSLRLPPGTRLSSVELARLSSQLKGALGERLERLAGGRLLNPANLRELKLGAPGGGGLGEFDPDHVCDEECLKPGGT